jgi:hypothetical protein
VGYAISWLAVQTKDEAALADAARLHATAAPDPDFESALAGVALPNGWFLFVAKGSEHRLIGAPLLAVLSARWPCVACSVEEHVMVSIAAYWRGGARQWEVIHDAQQEIFHLDASGSPPAEYAALRNEKIAEQHEEGGADADVDMLFDVPLLLAKQLTGYKHDEISVVLDGVVPHVFEDLQPPASRPWWKLW